MTGNLFIISSPSGGGKGTLVKRVLLAVPSVKFSVSYTTREVRDGEENGREYFFVEKDEFQRLIDQEEFLEHAMVHENFYGTSIKQVEKETTAGNDIILEIDVQGAEIVKRKLPSAVSVFILPPSFEVLSKRLIGRETEAEDALQTRLINAKEEVKAFNLFDYVVVNDEVEQASSDLISIFAAERLKRDRQINEIRDILNTFDT